MKYVFGPVPSRRLEQSLGIDTISLKTWVQPADEEGVMPEDELKRTLEQKAPDQAGPVLAELERSGRAQMVER